MIEHQNRHHRHHGRRGIMITGTGNILKLLFACTSRRQLSQIQAQILLRGHHSNPPIVSYFLTASCRLGLFSSGTPSFLSAFFSSNPHASPLQYSNSIIRYFSHNDPSTNVPFLVFSLMLQNSMRPDDFTYSSLLMFISDLRWLRQGQMVHAHIVKTGFESDIYVHNSLINLYSSCGHTANSEYLFDEMPVKDVVSWTSLITAYNRCRRFGKALTVFNKMQMSGVLPNKVTTINLLSACAGYRALNLGLSLHGLAERKGWRLDVMLVTSLIDMYGKCGRTDISIKLFNRAPIKEVITWNSLISCLSMNDGKEAVRLFFEMKHKGIKADEATLVAVLSACSRAGMVRDGEWIFRTLLYGEHGVMPGIKHYGCIIDMYSRAGLLEEALECIEVMPFEPNQIVWRVLLSGCMNHGSSDLSEIALKRLGELGQRNAAVCKGLLPDLYMENGKQRQLFVTSFGG